MIVSMTHLSKILRMKKRLSNSSWYSYLIYITLLGILTICIFLMRTVLMTQDYHIVQTELPVVFKPLEKHSLEENYLAKYEKITPKTPVVVLTTEAFFFGDLQSFSSDFTEVRDKFYVPHQNQQPDLDTLISQMEEWLSSDSKISRPEIAILVPTGEIPLPIVIQSLAYLKKSSHLKRVILGTGIL